MGCVSTTAQFDTVVKPSVNYIETQPKKDEQKKEEFNLLKQPQVKSIEQIQNNNIEVHQNRGKEDFEKKEDIPESPESKKEEERVMTAATEQFKHEAMKHVPEGKAFIFGQSQNQRKILLLDCQKMQFSILSSRPHQSNPPHKYQPKQIIFQESQQMLASNLFNKNSHPPYNFMFITFISDQTIFLCGGVNYQFQYISEQAFFFRVASIASVEPQTRRNGGNTLVGNKFQKLPFMKQKRYSHMGAYFKVGKLGYIYIFGGRGENEELLNSCQQYSIEQKKWREITPMKSARSTGLSMIFKSKIYVFAGYTGEKKRSKSIEVYDPFKNYWQTLNVKLHRGIQAGLLFSTKPNQVLLMGGNMELGSLKSVIKINLAEETYVWDSNMRNQRLLQKGVKLKDLIYVFGGDFQDTFQKYSLKDRKWKDHQFSFNQFISTDDVNSYQMATQTLEVNFDQTLLSKADNSVGQYERYCIFGNDNYPCILELNVSKWVLRKKVVPMALRLRCNMGVVKVMDGKYFLCGGIDSFQQKPSRASYIYYTGTNKAIQVEKMNCKKYQFAICGNSKYVYIFGGRNESGQIIRECQRYSFDEQKWTSMANLPNERTNGKAVMVGSKILLFGGQDTLQTITTIDIYDTQTDKFWNSQQSLSIPADIKGIYFDKKEKPGVYLFTFNQVLSKYYCYYLALDIPQKDQEIQYQKIEQNFSVVKDVEEKEINIKIIPFLHAFDHGNRVNFITPKGLFYWQPNTDLKAENKLQSQIVINQVEMMQYPIDKFSAV